MDGRIDGRTDRQLSAREMAFFKFGPPCTNFEFPEKKKIHLFFKKNKWHLS